MRKRGFGALLGLCLLLGLLPAGAALGLASSQDSGRRGAAAVLLAGTEELGPELPEAAEPEAPDQPETDGAESEEPGTAGAEEPAACSKNRFCSLPEGHAGECVLYEAAYQTEPNGPWYAGSLQVACDNVYLNGGVLLLRDVQLEQGVTVKWPLTITSNIASDEEPFTITYSPKNRGDYLLNIQLPVTNPRDYPFCLTDIILDGGQKKGCTSQSELVFLGKGALMLNSGAVIQNNDNVCTVGVGAGGLRFDGGMLYLNEGAAIRNCRGIEGGGVTLAGDHGVQMALNGGTIENCQSFRGGGVYIAGTNTDDSRLLARLYVQKGGIINNQAKITMEGFTCPDSSAPGYGGGIYMDRGIIITPPGYDGVVAGNHADREGGGIYNFRGTLNLYSGAVTGNTAKLHGGGITAISPSGNVVVGGTIRVTDNTSSDGGNNLYLDLNHGYLDPDLGVEGTDPTAPVRVAMPLTETASIGISRYIKPDATHYRVVGVSSPDPGPVGMYSLSESDMKKFYSDDPKFVVLLHENPENSTDPDIGKIVITNADVAFDNQNHGERPLSQLINAQHKVDEPDPLEEPGYTFEGWYTTPRWEEGDKWVFTENEVLTDEKPKFLYARWDPIVYPIAYDNDPILADGEEIVNNNPDTYNIESEDITLNTPIRVGYNFMGWKDVTETGISLFSTRLRSGDAKPDIPRGSIGERKFVAQWEKANPCKVTYQDGMDGKVFTTQVTDNLLLWADTPKFKGEEPKLQGYTFKGWYPAVNERVTNENTVYTAQWEETPNPPDPPGPTDPPGGGGGGGGSSESDPPARPDPGPGEEPPQDPGTAPTPDPGAEPAPDPGAKPTPDPGAEPAPGPGEDPPQNPGAEPEPEPAPAPQPDHIPKTGDPTHTALWAGCALTALAEILLTLRPRRRCR